MSFIPALNLGQIDTYAFEKAEILTEQLKARFEGIDVETLEMAVSHLAEQVLAESTIRLLVIAFVGKKVEEKSTRAAMIEDCLHRILLCGTSPRYSVTKRYYY